MLLYLQRSGLITLSENADIYKYFHMKCLDYDYNYLATTNIIFFSNNLILVK